MDYSRWAEMQQHPTNPDPSTDSYLQFYNAQQPSYTHYPFYPHQPQNPSPNPSYTQTSLKHHEISSIQYDVGLDVAPQPPGMESYAAMSSYPPTHVGYEAQAAVAYSHQPAQMGVLAAAAYYQDPNAATQNWAVNDAIRHFGVDPVGYAAAIKSLNKKSVVPLSSSSMLMNNNWINQPLANGFIQRTPNKTKVIQSMWCEVCKIDCNSKDVLDRHNMGKKHQRNVQKLQESMKGSNAPSSTTLLKTSMATNNRNLPGEMGSHIGGQMIMGTSTVAVGDDLETKRQKLMEGGATTDSVRMCTICNVACNSQVVFSYHLAGKKHAAQAGIKPPNGPEALVAANPNPIFRTNPLVRPPGMGRWRKIPKNPKIVQSAWCEVCKIDCNSKDALNNHKLGKKHKKKLEESKKDANASSFTAAPATAPNNPAIGPIENPANKGKAISVQQTRKVALPLAPVDDLETKRRKLMEGGAAADAVRVCTVCNVVCNSPTVFNFHVAGQKHAAMVEKQAAGIPAA